MSTQSPITARFTVTSKIAAVTSDDNRRYALDAVYVEPVRAMERVEIGKKATTLEPISIRQPVAQVYTAATNGISLAVRRETGLASEPCLLPNGMAKPGTRNKPNRVALNGRWESTAGKVAEAMKGRFFPRVKDIVESYPADSIVITLDADELRKIADAIGDGKNHCVNLIIDPAQPRMIGVRHNAEEKAGSFGLIMSCGEGTDAKWNRRPDIVKAFNSAVNEFKGNQAFIRDDERTEWETAVDEILNPPEVSSEKPVTIFKKPASCDVRGADALRVGPILGLSVSLPEIDPWCSFPSHQLADYVAKLEALGITVRIVDAV